MFTVEIVGAASGSEWDHPPWSTDDLTLALKYLTSLAKLLDAESTAPRQLRFKGPGFGPAPIDLFDAYSYDYLFSEDA